VLELSNKENNIVLTGITAKGNIYSKQQYYLGPDQIGKYKYLTITIL